MSLVENTSERRKDARFTVQATFRRHNKANSTRCTPVIGAKVRTAVEGRDDSSASGSLWEANIQRRLSGDEPE